MVLFGFSFAGASGLSALFCRNVCDICFTVRRHSFPIMFGGLSSLSLGNFFTMIQTICASFKKIRLKMWTQSRKGEKINR